MAQNLKISSTSKEILQALQSKIAGKPISRKIRLPAVVSNRLVQELKTRYVALEARWGDVTSRYTAEHPSAFASNPRWPRSRKNPGGNLARRQGMKAELGQLLGNNVRIVDPAEVPRRPQASAVSYHCAVAGGGLGRRLYRRVHHRDP